MTMTFGRSMQLTGLICGVAGLIFLIYAVNYIDRKPELDGSGFKWMLMYPLSGVFVLCCLPAMLFSPVKKLSILSALLGIGGIVLYALLWSGF